MKDFLSRAPFALIGSLGLVSLVSNFMSVSDDIQLLITAWQQVTRPIWDYTLGMIFNLPNPVKDYFTAGVIFTGMLMRSGILAEMAGDRYQDTSMAGKTFQVIFSTVVNMLVWPIMVIIFAQHTYTIHREYGSGSRLKVSWERQRASLTDDDQRLQVDKFWKARTKKITQMHMLWESAIYAFILIATSYVLIVS